MYSSDIQTGIIVYQYPGPHASNAISLFCSEAYRVCLLILHEPEDVRCLHRSFQPVVGGGGELEAHGVDLVGEVLVRRTLCRLVPDVAQLDVAPAGALAAIR